MPSDEAAIATVSTPQQASLDEVLTLLQQEINKLNDISGAQSVNWRQVEQLAAGPLAQGAQHFQVAAYWGVARMCNQGFGAITEGAHCLTTLVDQHWEQAEPSLKRMRGRMNAIAWWLERVLLWIKHYSGQPLAAALHEQALVAIDTFDRALNARCADAAPALYPLIKALQQLPVERIVDQSLVATSPLTAPAKAALIAEPAKESVDGAVLSDLPCQLSITNSRQPARPFHLHPDALQSLMDQAMVKAQAGALSAAIDLLHQAVSRFMPADQLRIQCQVTQLLFEAGQTKLALVRIKQALDQVKQYGLEQWDPPLAALVLQRAYSLLNATGSPEAAQELLLKLSLLDPAKAVESVLTLKKEINHG